MFDLSIWKLLVLAVIALVIFGPHELPKIASQAGRALRDLRRIAEGAKNDLREGLGPEFADFDIEDLTPKRVVQKHLHDDLNGGSPPKAEGGAAAQAAQLGLQGPPLLVAHHVELDADRGHAGQLADRRGDVPGDGVTQRAPRHGQPYLHQHDPIARDVDVLDHAELGDGPPDLGIEHAVKSLGNLLDAGRGRTRGDHAFMLPTR